MRRNDVASTSFRRHVPTRFLINQCQITSFLILISDITENSRIELRGIVLTVPSNQIKLTCILFYPSTWYICDFFLFHIETEGKGGSIIGGGRGAKGLLAHLSNYWGACPPLALPLPTPMDTTSRCTVTVTQLHRNMLTSPGLLEQLNFASTFRLKMLILTNVYIYFVFFKFYLKNHY